MIEKSELLRIPTFADLPDEQLEWFLSQCQEQFLKAGDTYIRQGDPAENMFVILEGEFQARGEINGETFAFPSAQFPQLVQKMPELATRLVGLMSDRIRETTRFEQQRDRLASLGKLSAGLAHELNNPASAAKRATSQLRDILKKIRDASLELGRRDLTSAQKSEIEKLEALFTQHDEPPLDALAVSDLEEQVDSLLRSHGQNDLWQLAADLARKNVKP